MIELRYHWNSLYFSEDQVLDHYETLIGWTRGAAIVR